MTCLRFHHPCVFLAVLSLSTSALAQGLYWESNSTGGPQGDRPRAAKNYTMPKKMKREDDSMAFILRLDKESIYILKPKEKTYSEISFAEMETKMKGASEQLNARMEEMKKRLKDLPADQRALLEKQIQNNPLLKGKENQDSKVEVTTGGEKKDILGHACARYVAKQDGKEILSAWSTKEIKEFADLRKDWIEMSKRMAAMNPLLGKGMGDAFEKIEGFPLETEMSGVKTTVTKVEPRKIQDAEFDVPADYTKTKSPLESDALPGLKVQKKKKPE